MSFVLTKGQLEQIYDIITGAVEILGIGGTGGVTDELTIDAAAI